MRYADRCHFNKESLLALAFFAGLVLSCDSNSTGPDVLPKGIAGSVRNQDSRQVADVGIHLVFPFDAQGSAGRVSKTRFMFDSQNIPVEYDLRQNYPNPFNPSTTIAYQLPQTSFVKLSVFDRHGELVRDLVNGNYAAGRYAVIWDGRNNDGLNISNGVYTYRLEAGDFAAQKEMLLDMLDPEHIRSTGAIPLVTSDSDGQFRLPFAQIPYGATVTVTDETGPEPLGLFTISAATIVLLGDGYQPLTRTLTTDTTQTIRMDFELVAN